MTNTKKQKTPESKETKPDLTAMVEMISQALHKKNQHFVLRTETEVVGAFYPSEQAEVFNTMVAKLNAMELKLIELENVVSRPEFQSVASEETVDAPKSSS